MKNQTHTKSLTFKIWIFSSKFPECEDEDSSKKLNGLSRLFNILCSAQQEEVKKSNDETSLKKQKITVY
jgi:hypothetical protein